MSLTRILPYAIVLATGACVKQGAVRTVEPAQQKVDLFQLCSDPSFATACTPSQPQQSTSPVRVDTNLSTFRAPFAG